METLKSYSSKELRVLATAGPAMLLCREASEILRTPMIEQLQFEKPRKKWASI
jgi:hypothetical protein